MAKRGQRGPKPPDHLGTESKALWRKLNADYDFGPHDLARLQCACEAYDRMTQARKTLAELGTTYEDARWKTPKARPEVAIERDSRLAFLRALRELGLDLEQDEPARPPALYK